jgi:nickel-dependent lactate racemase
VSPPESAQRPAAVARIRFGAWSEDRDLALEFPAAWRVSLCAPRDGPDVGEEGGRAAFARPIGAPRLREIARGRRRPCIVIDDLTRPTPGRRLVPAVLEELRAAGIEARDVLVLAGVANHRPMTRPDLERKVGAEVLAACRTSQHFSWDRCVPIGTTSGGTPVEINAEFLAADLRILVGSIIPHAGTGFSGGSKLLLPGLASIASAEAFHRGAAARGRFAVAESEARLEADEAARLAGVDFLVNSIPNSRMEIAGLVTGDVVAAHRAGVEIARRVFASPTPAGQDVCVLSLYPKDGEFLQHLTAFAPWSTAPQRIVREGGSIVVALEGGEGLGFHSLFGPGMRLAAPAATRVRGRDLAFFAPCVDRGSLPDAVRDDTRLFRSWDETLAWLAAKHGAQASVAVFPCATMQLAEAGG